MEEGPFFRAFNTLFKLVIFGWQPHIWARAAVESSSLRRGISLRISSALGATFVRFFSAGQRQRRRKKAFFDNERVNKEGKKIAYCQKSFWSTILQRGNHFYFLIEITYDEANFGLPDPTVSLKVRHQFLHTGRQVEKRMKKLIQFTTSYRNEGRSNGLIKRFCNNRQLLVPPLSCLSGTLSSLLWHPLLRCDFLETSYWQLGWSLNIIQ